ncbi:homeobox protein otx5-b [Plakobranchus ocellatus]|uniref:Homeobox protein otx5-b n=1 Tax=Plakobranchus ocellatus TaxID=259542 RepID=A0AAV4AG51_9GAST|nr:homeobox protein otx5-b [Plakobranchus ocellatus]
MTPSSLPCSQAHSLSQVHGVHHVGGIAGTGHAQQHLSDVSSLSPGSAHEAARNMASMAYPPSSHSHAHVHGHNHALGHAHSPKPSPYSVNGLSLSTPNVDLLHPAMGYQNDMFCKYIHILFTIQRLHSLLHQNRNSENRGFTV